MEREVFILPTGKSFPAWEVQFTMQEQHVDTSPVTHHERDGTISRTGRIHVTVETSHVSFCTVPDSLTVAQQGQLSSAGDQFFTVTVSAVEPAGDHELIRGQASRHVDSKLEWDR